MPERCLHDVLAVGTVAFVQFDVHRKDAKRYPVIIRGWETDRFIFFDRPRLDDGRYLLLRENQECIVRFAVDGTACAFSTVLIDWDMRTHAGYMRLAWPKQYECTSFRKQQRFSVNCSAKFTLPDGSVHEATLFDISSGGCGLETHIALEANTEVALHLHLPDGTPLLGVKAIVRNRRPRDTKFAIGCSFVEGQPEHMNALAFYFATRARLERGTGDSEPAIHGLVLDHSAELAGRIVAGLHAAGISCLHSVGLIDAFYRLRFLRPSFLLLRDEMLARAAPAVWEELAPLRSDRGKAIEIIIYGNAPLPEHLISGVPNHVRIQCAEDIVPLKLLKHLQAAGNLASSVPASG